MILLVALIGIYLLGIFPVALLMAKRIASDNPSLDETDYYMGIGFIAVLWPALGAALCGVMLVFGIPVAIGWLASRGSSERPNQDSNIRF